MLVACAPTGGADLLPTLMRGPRCRVCRGHVAFARGRMGAAVCRTHTANQFRLDGIVPIAVVMTCVVVGMPSVLRRTTVDVVEGARFAELIGQMR